MKKFINFAMAALAVIVMASCGGGVTKLDGETVTPSTTRSSYPRLGSRTPTTPTPTSVS